MPQQKSHSNTDEIFSLFFRLTMGWTFLWPAIHHFADDKFVLGFLSHVKTFHDVYEPLTNPDDRAHADFPGRIWTSPDWIVALFVRISAPFAIIPMLLYWTAHMDFPYVENVNNYL